MTTAENVLKALRAHNLKEKGGGKYTSNSPFRTGSDSGAFTLTINADGEHGAFHDFASDEKGSLYDLAKLLGIETAAITVATTKRAYTNIDDYARAHGITSDVLKAASWKPVTRESRPSLEFPTRTGKRWRFLDGKKPTYKSEQGYKKCWYGIEKALASLDAANPLIICNGEISTVVGIHYGLAAASVTSGEGEIPNELIAELVAKMFLAPNETTVIIALDCDRKGMEAARLVESQFKGHGFNARAVDLGLGSGGDLADFCTLHGAESLAALLKCPPLPVSESALDDEEEPLWRYDITELDNLPEIKWIIPGEIPEQGFVMLFGESNIGKSFIAVDYALQIAEKNNVVYVACEGENGLPLRVDGWLLHHRRTRSEFKDRFTIMGGPVSFFERANMDKFVDFIKPLKPYVIFIDTLGLIMGDGDENSAHDANVVIRGSRRLQRRFGCTLIFIHHTNKGGVQERGSGIFRNRMDTVIQVIPDDDLIIVESAKTRDSEKFKPKAIKLLSIDVPGKGETRVPVPADRVVRSTEISGDQRKLLDVMAMSIYIGGVAQRDLAEIARLTYGRTVRALSTLVDGGYVDKPRTKQEHHRISNKGRDAVGLPPLDQGKDVDQTKKPTVIQESLPVDHMDRMDQPFLNNSPAPVPNGHRDPRDPSDPSDPHGEAVRSTDPQPALFEVPKHTDLSKLGY